MEKPFPHKAYGSIPHLPGSKFSAEDKGVPPGEARLYLEYSPCATDTVVLTEKLDGSACAVYKQDGKIHALVRNGRPAIGSKWAQHRFFAAWVEENQARFDAFLADGEWCVGEWLAQAHGTRYDLTRRSPFPLFDRFFPDGSRWPFDQFFLETVKHELSAVPILAVRHGPIPLAEALAKLGEHGEYGALDLAEGVVYRRETKTGIYLAKYVRPEKAVGCYLGEREIWNWRPENPLMPGLYG